MTKKLIIKVKPKDDMSEDAKPPSSKFGRPPAGYAAPGRAAPAPRKSDSGRSGTQIKVFILVVAALGLAVAFCLILSSNDSQPRRTAGMYYPGRPGMSKEQPTRYKELGGLTMAEWERKNNRDNEELRARRERIRHHNATATE